MKYLRNQALLTTELQGRVVMINEEASKYYRLNRTGTDIWALLERPMEKDEIVGMLLKKYPVDRASCEKAVGSFLTVMTGKGLMKEVPA